jgi:L-alanine-DL-glutamate epimerase-like enolase superfamily enzyme
LKITNIRLRKLEGTLPEPPNFIQDRRRSPRIFVQIDTDEGVSGIAGLIYSPSASAPNAASFYIETIIKPLLIGKDPIASEALWDLMYRASSERSAGNTGDYMRALSYIDIALWDLKGKWVNKPVVQLLGGPVQEKIPAYVSTAGYSLEPEKASESVKQFKQDGYTATKWFFRQGPADGPEGIRKNIELMKALREAAGPDMKVMVDPTKGWDVPYTLKMAEALAEYKPYWFEEMLMPGRYEAFAEVTANCPVPIASGENESTRWAFQLMMDMKALDIYQPEPIICGGISEVMKICHMASARDLPVILHGVSLQANLAISFSQNAVTTPMMEYLIR